MYIMISYTFLKIVFILVSSCYGHEYDPKGWAAASKYLQQLMNPAIDPCDDFYAFVCGKWNDTYKESETEFDVFVKNTAETILKAIDEIDLDDSKTENFKKSLKIFYQQCKTRTFSDLKTFSRDTYEVLQKYLLPTLVEQKNGSERYPWDNVGDAHFWKFVGQLQSELGTPFLIEAQIQISEVNCKSQPVLHLYPTQLPKLFDDYMDFVLSEIVSEYHNITLSKNDTRETKDALNKFYDDWNALLAYNFDFRNTFTSIKITYHELQQRTPDINWSAYFDGLLPEDMKLTWLQSNPTIEIELFEYFKNLSALLKEHHQITTSNYGFLSVVLKYYEFFEIGAIKIKDFKNIFQSYPVFQNEDKCLDLVVRYFSAATFRLLCDKFKINLVDWRNDVLLIKENIFSAFIYLVKSADWIDAGDKMKLIQKVNKISFSGEIPIWITLDDVVELKTPKYSLNLSLIANDVLAQKELFKQQMKPLVTGSKDDFPPNFHVNAVHFMLQSDIKYFVGLQMPPFYMYSYPLAVKFGIFGWTLGHELMHGFGPKFFKVSSEYPHISLNLTNSTMNDFNEKTLCMVPLYNSYCNNKALTKVCFGDCLVQATEQPFLMMKRGGRGRGRIPGGGRGTGPTPGGGRGTGSTSRGRGTGLTSGGGGNVGSFRVYFSRKSIDERECQFGENTKEENVADIEGLKITYVAYKFLTQTMGSEPLLNGLTEYSSDQIFFIAAARHFCSNGEASDPLMWHSHSPFRARVEQPLMNFPPFAKAFNCPPGSRYVQNQTCSIYGNFWQNL